MAEDEKNMEVWDRNGVEGREIRIGEESGWRKGIEG